MILTEAEAKTKWCPFVRLGMMKVGATINRAFMTAEQAETQANTTCIGSACMAWRQAHKSQIAARLGATDIDLRLLRPGGAP